MEGVRLVCTGGLQTFFILLQLVYHSGEDLDTNRMKRFPFDCYILTAACGL